MVMIDSGPEKQPVGVISVTQVTLRARVVTLGSGYRAHNRMEMLLYPAGKYAGSPGLRVWASLGRYRPAAGAQTPDFADVAKHLPAGQPGADGPVIDHQAPGQEMMPMPTRMQPGTIFQVRS
jgi:hypothetical protein